jgi:CRP-like cAMP-binding protein
MDTFRKFIEQYVTVPNAEWIIISQAFERKEFARNEIILSEGKICRHFYFLDKGLVRFFSNSEGKDITKFFTVAPYCITSKNSFRNQIPSQESIQALERAVVWQTTLEKSEPLLDLKSWNTFTRKFVHEVQSYTEELMMQIKTETAEQRYRKLLEKHPAIIQKIPLKHLSSFLGIAPQSLSRIRKKYL